MNCINLSKHMQAAARLIQLADYSLKQCSLLHPATIEILRLNRSNGGGRGIRTPARYDPPVGFQDRSLQPNLGIPPDKRYNLKHLVAAKGVEPPTFRV
jgi:hypothetical protein